jgi:hypothetical protein
VEVERGADCGRFSHGMGGQGEGGGVAGESGDRLQMKSESDFGRKGGRGEAIARKSRSGSHRWCAKQWENARKASRVA